MSIAQAQKQRELEKQLSTLIEQLAALSAAVKDVVERVEAIENKPRPGRPPKDQP